MIARTNRFHGHGSLRYTYQHGRTLRTPMFSVVYAANSKRDSYRAAVVVSKKVSKRAVVRNRLRRRMYEVIRLSAPQFNGVYDLVVTIHNESLADVPADQLTKTFHKTLQGAHLLKP